MSKADFDSLEPFTVIDAVEKESGLRFSPVVHTLPSYINRVYELQDDDGNRYVAKFYRPGRWSKEAIREEHDFMEDCSEMDIPLALPEILESDDTLGQTEDGILFALYPHMSGRLWEFKEDDEQWFRLGQLLGRMHRAGRSEKASHRTVIHPESSFRRDCREILESGWIPGTQAQRFEQVTKRIFDLILPVFDDVPLSRIHGDFHCGNILDRMDEGLMIIDFDDMATGPAVQDFWLLLPGHASACRREFFLLQDGYSDFAVPDPGALNLVEPLRAMRMVYFLAWCGRQKEDFSFHRNHPEWGSEGFWDVEIRDLENQYREILDFMEDP
ncbi:MAG: serine/threonine protein kinase [Spirochaetales bacterium]|nr:serine/threonine protein kinase [Spirochaetales bacterium]